MWHIPSHRSDHGCRVLELLFLLKKSSRDVQPHPKSTSEPVKRLKELVRSLSFLMSEDEARDSRPFFICRDRNGHWRRSCKFLRVYLYSLFILNMLLPANSKLKSFSRKLLLETSCNVGAHCIRLLDNFSLFLKHKLTDGLILFWVDN